MENSKLYRLLVLLREDEAGNDWHEFSKFLRSDYFGQSEHHIRLFQYIRENRARIQHGEAAYFTKERLYAATFDRKVKQALRKKERADLRRKQSQLGKKLKTYFRLRALEDNPNWTKMAEVQAWRMRGEMQYFERSVERQLQQLKQIPCPGAEQLYLAYKLREENFLYGFDERSKKYSGASRPLQQMLTHARHWYVLVGLRSLAELVIRSETYGENNLEGRSEEMVFLLGQAERSNGTIPLITLYANLVQMQLSRCTSKLPENVKMFARDIRQHLEQTVDYFDTQSSGLPPEEKHALIGWMANLAESVFKQGDADYAHLAFRIYQLGHEQNCLALDGEMAPGLLINFCTFAARAGAHDMVFELVQHYQGKLPNQYSDLTQNLCLAYALFFQGKFMSAHDLLEPHLSGPPYYQLQSRSLILRCLYKAMPQDDGLKWLFDSNVKRFRTYLSRNQEISPFKKESFRNFISRMQELSKLQPEAGKADKDHTLRSIKQKVSREPTAFSLWLLHELDGAEKKGRAPTTLRNAASRTTHREDPR